MTNSRMRVPLLTAVFGAVALFTLVLAPPSGAQLQQGTCPASVDTVDEGWICSILVLETPTDSPTEAQMDLWSNVLAQSGRFGVTDGIVFSDASVDAKVRTLYETQLDRQPDGGGLEFWTNRVQAARTEFAVEFGLFGSGEYLSRFESTEAFVADQYEYYLGREASRSEQAYWAGRLIDGDLSNEGITRAIATSPEAGNVRIASTAERQAYISEVSGQPTGGRQLYVDDAVPAADDVLRFTVIAGPGADCAVVAVIDDVGSDHHLGLDTQNRSVEPFGVTQVVWE